MERAGIWAACAHLALVWHCSWWLELLWSPWWSLNFSSCSDRNVNKSRFHSALQWMALLLSPVSWVEHRAGIFTEKALAARKVYGGESGSAAVELREGVKSSGRGDCAKCYLPIRQGFVIHGIACRGLEADWVIAGRWGEIMGLQLCGPTSHSSFPTGWKVGGGFCLQSSVVLICASFYVCHSEWGIVLYNFGYTGSVLFYLAYCSVIRSFQV